MAIVFKNITRDQTDLENIKHLYQTAFPDDERAPFGLLMKRAARRNVNFFSCRDGDKWVGLIYIVNYRDDSYVFYFDHLICILCFPDSFKAVIFKVIHKPLVWVIYFVARFVVEEYNICVSNSFVYYGRICVGDCLK